MLGFVHQIPVMIDRASPVPLYHQLAEQLTAAVEDGTLQPGDPFENELALADPHVLGLQVRCRGEVVAVPISVQLDAKLQACALIGGADEASLRKHATSEGVRLGAGEPVEILLSRTASAPTD